MELELRGRTAIVTGGASGIGRAAVLALAACGAEILIVDLNTDRAKETIELAGEDAPSVTFEAADIADAEGTAKAVASAASRWGRIDILFNNAGIVDKLEPAHRIPVETWERVMRVNITGTFLMTRAVLPFMLAQKRGVIINNASAAGLRGGGAGPAYTASKHAVVGLTRNIATMYKANGVRCNAICPGMVRTNLLESALGSFDEEGYAALTESLASLGRSAEPSEVAAVVAFLASDRASFVNGAIWSVDGGWVAA